MRSQEITLHVEPGAADAYRSASEEERRKLDLILSLRLSEATQTTRSLRDVMREMSSNARKRGLTPEILESLLGEE